MGSPASAEEINGKDGAARQLPAGENALFSACVAELNSYGWLRKNSFPGKISGKKNKKQILRYPNIIIRMKGNFILSFIAAALFCIAADASEKVSITPDTHSFPIDTRELTSVTATEEQTKEQTKKIIGRFRDQWGVYTLYKVDEKYYLESKYFDGSGGTDRLEVKIRNNRRTYNIIGDPYEYYEIRNGRMYIYDYEGYLGPVYDPA